MVAIGGSLHRAQSSKYRCCSSAALAAGDLALERLGILHMARQPLDRRRRVDRFRPAPVARCRPGILCAPLHLPQRLLDAPKAHQYLDLGKYLDLSNQSGQESAPCALQHDRKISTAFACHNGQNNQETTRPSLPAQLSLHVLNTDAASSCNTCPPSDMPGCPLESIEG